MWTLALVLELEEQAVAAGVGNSVMNRTARPAAPVRAARLGMDVQEGEIALPQRHQVATGTEVALGRDRPAARA